MINIYIIPNKLFITMKGTHNTMSFLPAKRLWMKLLTPWSKCQSKTVQEQLEDGVRYFDIRIRPYKKGKDFEPHFCHNHIDYGKANLKDSLNIINDFSKSLPDVNYYLRITLDVRKKPNNAAVMALWFKDYVNELKESYPNIIFDSIKIFWDWSNDLGPQTVKVIEKQWSVVPKKWYEFLWPIKKFAAKYNPGWINDFDTKYSKSDPDEHVLLIDFI